MPGRHRWMYNATGMPGWMRFGYSPGWIGRSPTGRGPCATYLMTGRWPAPYNIPGFPATETNLPQASPIPFASKEHELEILEEQSKALSAQLEAIRKRIEELKSET